MSDVKPIPDGHGGIIPHLIIDGAAEALDFYAKAFGAEEVLRMPAPDGARLMHASFRIGASMVYLADEFKDWGPARSPRSLGQSSVTIHQYVEDVDAAVKRAKDAGATVKMEPADMFWGDRYGTVTDPYGHEWSFATRIADPTPEEMDAAAKAMFGGGQ